jgi:ribosome-associated toxin RatA of RatAB toxin-antitoxin module
MEAELVVGFGMLNEKYLSRVTMEKPASVVATSSQSNVFEFLRTQWKFTPTSNAKGTWVSFEIDFKFKSAIYANFANLFMQEVVDKQVKAFEQRCAHPETRHYKV